MVMQITMEHKKETKGAHQYKNDTGRYSLYLRKDDLGEQPAPDIIYVAVTTLELDLEGIDE